MNAATSLAPAKIWSVIAFSANIAATFFLLKQVVVTLPPTGAGIWMLCLTLCGYVNFLDFGFSQIVTREAAYVFATASLNQDDSDQKIANLHATHFRMQLLVFLTTGFAFAAIGLAVIFAANSAPAVIWALVWGLLFVAAWSGIFANINLAIINAKVGPVLDKKLRASSSALAVMLICFVPSFDDTGVGLALVVLIQSCVLLLGSHVMKSNVVRGITNGVYRKSIAKLVKSDSFKWAATSLGALLILQTGVVVTAFRVSASAVPSYDGLARLLTALMGLSLLFSSATLPLQAQLFAKKDDASLLKIALENVRLASITVLAGSVFLFSQSDIIFGIWLGPHNVPNKVLVGLLAVAFFLEAHHTAFAHTASACGRLVFAIPALVAGALALTIAWTAAPYIGTIAVGAAILISQGITNNWYVPYYVIRFLKIPLKQYLSAVASPIFFAAILLATANVLISHFVLQPYVQFALCFAASMLIVAKEMKKGLGIKNMVSSK